MLCRRTNREFSHSVSHWIVFCAVKITLLGAESRRICFAEAAWFLWKSRKKMQDYFMWTEHIWGNQLVFIHGNVQRHRAEWSSWEWTVQYWRHLLLFQWWPILLATSGLVVFTLTLAFRVWSPLQPALEQLSKLKYCYIQCYQSFC